MTEKERKESEKAAKDDLQRIEDQVREVIAPLPELVSELERELGQAVMRKMDLERALELLRPELHRLEDEHRRLLELRESRDATLHAIRDVEHQVHELRHKLKTEEETRDFLTQEYAVATPAWHAGSRRKRSGPQPGTWR